MSYTEYNTFIYSHYCSWLSSVLHWIQHVYSFTLLQLTLWCLTLNTTRLFIHITAVDSLVSYTEYNTFIYSHYCSWLSGVYTEYNTFIYSHYCSWLSSVLHWIQHVYSFTLLQLTLWCFTLNATRLFIHITAVDSLVSYTEYNTFIYSHYCSWLSGVLHWIQHVYSFTLLQLTLWCLTLNTTRLFIHITAVDSLVSYTEYNTFIYSHYCSWLSSVLHWIQHVYSFTLLQLTLWCLTLNTTRLFIHITAVDSLVSYTEYNMFIHSHYCSWLSGVLHWIHHVYLFTLLQLTLCVLHWIHHVYSFTLLQLTL